MNRRLQACGAAFALAATLAAAAPVRVGIDEANPLSLQAKPGDAGEGGFFPALLETIAEGEGWKLEFVPGHLPLLLESLARDELDLVLAAPFTDSAPAGVAFSRETVISTWAQIYQAPSERRVQSMLDLDGLTVGVIRDALHNAELRRVANGLNIHCTFVEMATYDDAVDALTQNWIDAAVLDRLYAVTRRLPDGLRPAPVVFAPIELRIAGARGGGRDLLATVDYHLAQWKSDPHSRYYELLNQLLGNGHEFRVFVYVQWALAGALLLLTLLAAGTTLLRRQIRARTAELVRANQDLRGEIAMRATAESALRESQERYRSFLRHFQGIAFRHDPQNNPVFMHGAVEAITGYEERELLAPPMRWRNLVHPEDLAVYDRHLAQAREAVGEPVRCEYRIVTRSGETRWLYAQLQAVWDDGGRESMIQGSLHDITERKEAERAQLLLSTAVEQASEGIVVTDHEAVIRYTNPAFREMTGYSAGELRGQRMALLKSGHHSEDFYADMWRTLRVGHNWSGQFVNRRKDGSLYTDETNISPVRDAGGRVTSYVGLKRDVTEQLAREAQRHQSQKMEAIGLLAGGIAHDFNNILMVIMGCAEYAREQLPPGAGIRQDLDMLLQSASRAADLTRQLLTFSRQQPTTAEPSNLNGVIEGTRMLLTRLLGEDVELVFQEDPMLYTIMADHSQLEQILVNLAVNARDALPGGGRITIATGNATLTEQDQTRLVDGAACAGPYAFLSVADTGCGMDRATLARIFEPFFTTKGTGRGTGLGLATVYALVKRHQGFINVESAPGQGSIFRVYFPQIAERRAIAGAPTAAGLEPGRGGSERILLVEDEQAVRLVTARMLKSAGYEVVEAPTAEEALTLADAGLHLDLLLTDVVLPGMDGKGLADTLRRRQPGLRVIYCSGYTQDRLAAPAGEESGIVLLQKPVTRDELLRKVRDVLDATPCTSSPVAYNMEPVMVIPVVGDDHGQGVACRGGSVKVHPQPAAAKPRPPPHREAVRPR